MYRQLTRLRMRWYAAATGRVLVRHWQLFVIAGVFVPIGTPVGKLVMSLAMPLMMVLRLGSDSPWHFERIVLIQGIALVWVMVQRRHILGGEFMVYAQALPISLRERRWVNVSVLLPANSLLLVPVAALLMVAPAGVFGATSVAFLLASAGALASLVLLAQLAVLERHPAAVPAIGLADGVLSWGLTRPAGAAGWLALGACVLFGVSFLLVPPGLFKALRQAILRCASAGRKNRLRQFFRFLPPARRMQMQVLGLQHAGSTALRMVMAMGLVLGADMLMQIFAYDTRALPTAILAMAAVALIISGLYRVLRSAHLPVLPYLHALPLPRRFWATQDTGLVVALGAVPLAVLLIPLGLHRGSAALTLLALTLAYFALLALLRFPLIYGGRQAVLLGGILASAWSGVAMAAVVR
ncbi:hypothetical protein GALL_340350 [mine drainage metagenome]|uniref:Uncharacterized protein n=1 Tax=mine drainage metagenome TaxID=410659 RepID=A0A1J5QKT1_9ZZZZ